jgi:large conductance mechanosensitive channel
LLQEFKKFAMRGNVVDLAIGVIIGAAFGGIVQSIVNDIFMPIIGAVLGGLDFSNNYIPLSSKITADSLTEAKKQGAVLAWGTFVTVTINFLIVAWVLFLVVRAMNRMMRTESEKSAPPSKQEELLTEIRDLLREKSTGPHITVAPRDANLTIGGLSVLC